MDWIEFLDRNFGNKLRLKKRVQIDQGDGVSESAEILETILIN